MKNLFVATCLAVAILGTSSTAGAQEAIDPNLLASRREMIDRASQARTAGRHDEALDLAQRAGRIQMTPSLRLFIAQAQQAAGQLGEALGSSLQCQSEASRDAAASGRTIERVCGEMIVQLRPRIGRIVVSVSNAPPSGMHVFISNRELHALLLGNDYVVTPGDVAVRIIAPEFAEYTTNVRVGPGSTVPLVVTLVRASAAITAAATTAATSATTHATTHATTTLTTATGTATNAATNTATTAPTTATRTAVNTANSTGGHLVVTENQSPPTAGATTASVTGATAGVGTTIGPSPIVVVPPIATPARGPNVGGIALLAAGGAAVVTGAIFLGLSSGAAGEYNMLCTPTCTSDSEAMGRAAFDRANMFTAVGIAGLSVGVVGAGVGVALMVMGGSARASAVQSAGLRFGIGSIAYTGSF